MTLIFVLILTGILFIFGFGGDFVTVIKKTLEPLNKITGPEKLSIIFRIIIDMFAMFLIYHIIYIFTLVILNWIYKKILSFFRKKQITLFKMLNISIYSLLLNKSLILILLVVGNFLAPKLDNMSEDLVIIALSLPVMIANILSLILYFYGVKISTKNKFA